MEKTLQTAWQTLENKCMLGQPYVAAQYSDEPCQPTDLSVGGHPTAPPHEFIRGYVYGFIRGKKTGNQSLKK